MFGVSMKSAIVGTILWLGIMANPSQIFAGLVLSSLVYIVSIVVFDKKPGWRILIGLGLTTIIAVGIAIIHPGVPYLADMPIQGAMMLSAILSALIYPKRKAGEKSSRIERLLNSIIDNKINKKLK